MFFEQSCDFWWGTCGGQRLMQVSPEPEKASLCLKCLEELTSGSSCPCSLLSTFCSLGEWPQISPINPASLSFHWMTLPASEKTPRFPVWWSYPARGHSASPGEEQIYFFSCFKTLLAAYCFNAVHNYRNGSENLYILSVFYYTRNRPQFFFFYMNQLKIYFGVLYVILKLNSQFLL